MPAAQMHVVPITPENVGAFMRLFLLRLVQDCTIPSPLFLQSVWIYVPSLSSSNKHLLSTQQWVWWLLVHSRMSLIGRVQQWLSYCLWRAGDQCCMDGDSGKQMNDSLPPGRQATRPRGSGMQEMCLLRLTLELCLVGRRSQEILMNSFKTYRSPHPQLQEDKIILFSHFLSGHLISFLHPNNLFRCLPFEGLPEWSLHRGRMFFEALFYPFSYILLVILIKKFL